MTVLSTFITLNILIGVNPTPAFCHIPALKQLPWNISTSLNREGAPHILSLRTIGLSLPNELKKPIPSIFLKGN